MPRDEVCTVVPRSPRPDILDHDLQIEFRDTSTGLLQMRARFHIFGDAQVHRFIRSNPTWRRGCWPVGLTLLYDYLWEKKIVEVPPGGLTDDGGVRDPARGITYIHASYEVFNGRGAVIPLVNLANTHVMDQMRRFFAIHPDAAPQPARAATVMAAERLRLEAEAKAKTARQRQALVLLRPTTRESYVFIDESGDPGFRSLEDVYVFTAIIVPQSIVDVVRADLRAILARRWPETPPAELHLHQVPDSFLAAVQNDLASVMQCHDLRAYAFTAHKWSVIKNLCRRHMENRRSAEAPMDFEWDQRVNDPRYQFRYNFLGLTMEEVVSHLALDFLLQGSAAHFRHDRKRNQWMNDALHEGFRRGLDLGTRYALEIFGRPQTLAASFDVADSENEPCIWLSDWLSGEIRNWIVAQASLSPAYETIKDRLQFIGYDEDGVKVSYQGLGGKVEKSFPDLPRPMPEPPAAAPSATEEASGNPAPPSA